MFRRCRNGAAYCYGRLMCDGGWKPLARAVECLAVVSTIGSHRPRWRTRHGLPEATAPRLIGNEPSHGCGSGACRWWWVTSHRQADAVTSACRSWVVMVDDAFRATGGTESVRHPIFASPYFFCFSTCVPPNKGGVTQVKCVDLRHPCVTMGDAGDAP
jgi:hypothetical protein